MIWIWPESIIQKSRLECLSEPIILSIFVSPILLISPFPILSISVCPVLVYILCLFTPSVMPLLFPIIVFSPLLHSQFIPSSPSLSFASSLLLPFHATTSLLLPPIPSSSPLLSAITSLPNIWHVPPSLATSSGSPSAAPSCL